jgi:hypothetical protein
MRQQGGIVKGKLLRRTKFGLQRRHPELTILQETTATLS